MRSSLPASSSSTITSWPTWARQAAVTRPTWPAPITVTRMLAGSWAREDGPTDDSNGCRPVRNRSDFLVRLVHRCETAAAMRTRRTPPLRLLRLLLVAAILAAGLLPGQAAQAAPATAAPRAAPGPGREVRARYAILVEPATGEVLWSRRSRTPAPPASLTKMLTALAVRASLDLDGVTVASRASVRQPARRLALKRGQRLTVDQALESLMIVSANDVAVMLAEAAGGSVTRFARAMDAESQRLGLRGSAWRNPNGLDVRGHRSTAFDLAILARAVLQDRWLARVVRMRHAAFTTPNGRHVTLTTRSRFLLGYRGAVGVKTGFTDDAGHCLAAAATRGGRTLVAVVLHSPDNAADAGRMLDWGFCHGRSAGTGLRLPDPVPPSSVAALLARPPLVVERHRPAVPEALASAGLARVGATPAARPGGAQSAWSWPDRQRLAA